MAAYSVNYKKIRLDKFTSFNFLVLFLLLKQPSHVTSIPANTTELTTTKSTAFTILETTLSSNAFLLSSTLGGLYNNDSFNQNVSFNSSDSSSDKNLQYGTVSAVIITIILLCIIVGTIVGNILVCIAVCLVRKLRRPCNYLLVSLAVSDLCVAILVMPMAMIYEILGNWPFGTVFCDLWVSFDVLSCTASILNLCMISVDRYYAITKPLEYGVKRTPRRMILCVILVWVVAACISLPPLLILGNEREELQCTVCQYFGYQIYATLGSFYIPLIVMIVVYYKIFRAARKIVMEEKRAQSHLESHCYLEINVKNGGAAESKLLAKQAAPAANRSSSVGTNTSCGVEKSLSTIGRCFSGEQRKSNESQCPMLQTCNTPLNKTNQGVQGSIPQETQTAGPKARPNQQTKTKKQKSCTFKRRDSLNIFKSNKDSKEMTINQQTHQKKLRFQLAKERKASTTLGIIMSAFTVCWLPFFVLALIRPFGNVPTPLSSLFLWLGYANSLLNPIIYATLNKDFRKPFQEILYFRCSNLNHMMREEFYHSQYGDPEQHYCAVNTHKVQAYEESVEIVTADDRELKERTSESFL